MKFDISLCYIREFFLGDFYVKFGWLMSLIVNIVGIKVCYFVCDMVCREYELLFEKNIF